MATASLDDRILRNYFHICSLVTDRKFLQQCMDIVLSTELMILYLYSYPYSNILKNTNIEPATINMPIIPELSRRKEVL